MILDLPGPYSKIVNGITKESMWSKGVEVNKIENLIINGLPATFVIGSQKAYGNTYTKFILILGTEIETIMINGVFPENSKKIGSQIKKSMLSVLYDADKNIDPFEAIDYSVDVSQTKLIFAKSMSNSLIFTVDGQLPTNNADKTNLVIGKSFSPINTEDKKLFSINRIEQLPIEIERIEYTNEISIDGLSGFEIFATAKSKSSGELENIYQVILFIDQYYYIFLGTTNDTTNKSIDDIKTAILSFKRK